MTPDPRHANGYSTSGEFKDKRTRQGTFPLVVATLLAAAIFVLDSFSGLDFAVAVVYVIVVLVVGTYLDRTSVVFAAIACTALTFLSFLLTKGQQLSDVDTIRASMSVAGIGVTTFLALKNRTLGDELAAAVRQRTNLSRFFSPQMVDELAQMDRPLSTTRSQSAAVMFVDMVGFTAFCARLSPEQVIALLRNLHSILSECVFEHNGVIDKFLGDGLIAVFGPPLPGSNDATNAARCALRILQSVEHWNIHRIQSGEEPVHIVVGIHYGPIVQGDIGSESRLEFTVVGDTVNIASRVEGYCRQTGFDVLATSSLIEAIATEGNFDLAPKFVDLGEHRLRGHEDPEHLYGAWKRTNLLDSKSSEGQKVH
jgi:adenylate cyclase